MNSLTEMRSRFDDGFSTSDREYIETLYAKLLSKKVRRRGCRDCYRDAYVDIHSYLKKEGKMPKKPNYVLKAGVVIHPQGTNKFYANANIPDEVAEEHLAKFPNAIESFAVYPADYAIRVEERKNGEAHTTEDVEGLANAYQEAKAARKEAENALEATKAELEATKTELEALKANLSGATANAGDGCSDDGALAREVETLKADLASAKEENEALKKELEEVKAASTKKKTTAKAAE